MNKPKLYLYNYNQCNGIETIKLYVSSRYPRYMDYSRYHATMAGIPDEANDVLHTVLLSLFSKDFEYLAKLFERKKGQYTELDWIILRMLKMNCHSLTSPYRHKNKPITADHGVDYQKLKIIDETDEEPDNAGTTLKQFRLVRYIFERLELTELEKKVFEHVFLLHLNQSEFPSVERSKFYKTYYVVRGAIHEILFHHKLTMLKPKIKVEGRKRKDELVERFLQSRKVTITHSEN